MHKIETAVPFLSSDFAVAVSDEILGKLAAHGLKQKLGDAAAVAANKHWKSLGYDAPKATDIKRESPDDYESGMDAAREAVEAAITALESGDWDAGDRGDRLSSLARDALVARIKARGITTIALTKAGTRKGKPVARAVAFNDLVAAYAAHDSKDTAAVKAAILAAVRPAYEAELAAARAAKEAAEGAAF